jgi:hypothetical protein
MTGASTSLLKTWIGVCRRAFSGRSWEHGICVQGSCSSVRGTATKTQRRTAQCHRTSLWRQHAVPKWRMFASLHSSAVLESQCSRREPRRCHFSASAVSASVRPSVTAVTRLDVSCGEPRLSCECSAPKEDLKYCGCGDNHTPNYLGCGKWEAEAALARRARGGSVARGGAPGGAVWAVHTRPELSVEQLTLGDGWNNVLRGSRVPSPLLLSPFLQLSL